MTPRPFLMSACMAQCSIMNHTTPHDTSGGAADKERVWRPKTLEASIGGFLGASYHVRLQADGRLRYQSNAETFTPLPGTKTERLNVTDQQWQSFRESLDQANVWAWKREYLAPEVLDGTQWHFQVTYADASIASHGSNAYPNKEEFERFRMAVVKLLNGKNFH